MRQWTAHGAVRCTGGRALGGPTSDTPPSATPSRELDAIASAEAPELTTAISGFATALHWLDAESAQLPC